MASFSTINVLVIVLGFLPTVLLGPSTIPEAETELTAQEAFDKLLELEIILQRGLGNLINNLMTRVTRSVDVASKEGPSQNCLFALLKLTGGIKKMKMDAFKIVDSFGKISSGFLTGTLGWFGNYDECLNEIDHNWKTTDHASDLSKTRFCFVDFRPPLPPKPKSVVLFHNIFSDVNGTFKTELMEYVSTLLFFLYDNPIRIGVCVPRACSRDDVEILAKAAANKIKFNSQIYSCETRRQFSFSQTQLIIACSFGALMILTVICTWWSYFFQSCEIKNSSCTAVFFKFTKCFSIIDNFGLISSMERKETKPLDFLDGLRCLSLFWIILGHSYLFTDHHVLNNPLNMHSMRKNPIFTMIISAFLGIDTFFFIGAFLLAYVSVKKFDERGSFKPIISTLRRIWRLQPPHIALILFTIILPLLGSGPLWNDYFQTMSNQCLENGWLSALLISNLVKPFKSKCLLHTWYIEVDFQLHLIGLLYLFIFYKNRRCGYLFLVFLIFASTLSIGLVTYIFDYPPTFLLGNLVVTDAAADNEYTSKIYQQAYTHFVPYALGLLLGTYVARNQKLQLSKKTSIFGWVFAIPAGLAATLGQFPWNRGVEYTTVGSTLFASTFRAVWALFLVWFFLSCYGNRNGVVTRLLSWGLFKPLSQMSYLFYLIQFLVIFTYVATRRSLMDFNHVTIIWSFFGSMCLTQIAALIAFILVDSPMSQLGKIFFDWLEADKTTDKIEKTPEILRLSVLNSEN